MAEFGFQLVKGDYAAFAFFVSKRDGVTPDVDVDDTFLSLARADLLSLSVVALSVNKEGAVLVHQAAHESTAAATDLGRIQREPLVLCQLETHWLQFREPRGAA